MEIIITDSGTPFNSKDFQEGLYVHAVRLELASTEHHEMNGQVNSTWKN